MLRASAILRRIFLFRIIDLVVVLLSKFICLYLFVLMSFLTKHTLLYPFTLLQQGAFKVENSREYREIKKEGILNEKKETSILEISRKKNMTKRVD